MSNSPELYQLRQELEESRSRFAALAADALFLLTNYRDEISQEEARGFYTPIIAEIQEHNHPLAVRAVAAINEAIANLTTPSPTTFFYEHPDE